MEPTEGQDVVRGLYNAVLHHDRERCENYCAEVIRLGVDIRSAMVDGLGAGMTKAGELYNEGEYFIPDIIVSADILFAGLEILKPHLHTGAPSSPIHTVVLGSVEGDIHDIGRKLVKIMYQAAGWKVYDIGINAKVECFLEEQEKTRADVIGLSALMTTSMHNIPSYIDRIRRHNDGVVIMVGGAPMNHEIAEMFGADGFAPNCGVVVGETLIALKKKMQNT
jgi:methylmalonyl-CoA mutase cobalamin-binding domain/chain